MSVQDDSSGRKDGGGWSHQSRVRAFTLIELLGLESFPYNHGTKPEATVCCYSGLLLLLCGPLQAARIIQFPTPSCSVTEGAGAVEISIARANDLSHTVVAEFATVYEGSATPGSDYTTMVTEVICRLRITGVSEQSVALAATAQLGAQVIDDLEVSTNLASGNDWTLVQSYTNHVLPDAASFDAGWTEIARDVNPSRLPAAGRRFLRLRRTWIHP